MKKKILCIAFALVFVIGAASTIHIIASPGSGDDPLITLSYIEEVLMPNIRQTISEQSPNSFKVVEVSAGQRLTCEAGTELVLRMGSGTVFATEKGGIANVTAGYDLQNGSSVPSNAHLIVPVGDGRGISATSNIIVLVKGSYSIN